jgi:general secretion pathway protein G
MRVPDNENWSRSGVGFTLLEMMAVITLILILATFALPVYHSLEVRSREATLRQQLITLRSQIDRFTHDNEHGPASLKELVDRGYMGEVPVDPLTGSSETWQTDDEKSSLSAAGASSDGAAPVGIADAHSG